MDRQGTGAFAAALCPPPSPGRLSRLRDKEFYVSVAQNVNNARAVVRRFFLFGIRPNPCVVGWHNSLRKRKTSKKPSRNAQRFTSLPRALAHWRLSSLGRAVWSVRKHLSWAARRKIASNQLHCTKFSCLPGHGAFGLLAFATKRTETCVVSHTHLPQPGLARRSK